MRGCRNSSYTSFDTIKTLPNRTAVHTTDSNDFAYIASSKFFNVTVSGTHPPPLSFFLEIGGATSDLECLTLCDISHSQG
jgi:hypothetical protein